MGFFKKNDEVLDLTLLQRRGILKTEEIKEDVDLTSVDPVSPVQAVAQGGSPFDFLDLAASAANQGSFQPEKKLEGPADLEDLKIKLENLEYKFERFLERLEKFEEKLSQIK